MKNTLLLCSLLSAAFVAQNAKAMSCTDENFNTVTIRSDKVDASVNYNGSHYKVTKVEGVGDGTENVTLERDSGSGAAEVVFNCLINNEE